MGGPLLTNISIPKTHLGLSCAGSGVLSPTPFSLSLSIVTLYCLCSLCKIMIHRGEMVGENSSELPPGFRFHPTDEELIMYYLRNQATSKPCPVSIIPEIDIYKFDPWELPDKAEFGENEWYFFTPRERKYPNGVRPNRAAVSGYWKATGTDKAIYSGSKYVGVKKALVFYTGKPPKGVKTDWIMHEYRLSGSTRRQTNKQQNGSMRLDDWVLCRIYKKKNVGRAVEQQKAEDYSSTAAQTVASIDEDASNDSYRQMLMKFPRTASLSNLWELEYCLGSSLPQLLSDNSSYNPSFDYNNHPSVSIINGGNGGAMGMERIPQLGVQLPYQYTDSLKLEANNNHSSSSLVNQPIFVNPTMYQFH